MKQTIALAILCIAAHAVIHAQIQKNAVLLGGQISFYSSKSADASNTPSTNTNNAFFNISAGKAIRENTVVGIYGGYGQGKTEYIFSNSTSNTSAATTSSAGIFYRKYKGLGRKFYFLGELNAGYRRYKQENENKVTGATAVSTNTETGVEMGLTPGLSYQLLKKMQLEVLMPAFAGLRYATTKNSGTNIATSTGNVFQFSTSLNNSLLNSMAVGFKLIL
jgi:Autotransporter beta-domain